MYICICLGNKLCKTVTLKIKLRPLIFLPGKSGLMLHIVYNNVH